VAKKKKEKTNQKKLKRLKEKSLKKLEFQQKKLEK
jgi:hypothetical protein